MSLSALLRSSGLLLLLSALFLSCRDGGEEPSLPLFFQLQVRGEEDAGEATLLLRFHEGGPGSGALRAQGPVLLDGQPLSADSAPVSGVHYEARLSLAEFTGPHRLSFPVEGKIVSDSFLFRPFVLQDELSGRVSRQNLALHLEGIEPGTRLYLVMTDTSFRSPDVNETLVYRGGVIHLAPLLPRLVNGPVLMQLSSERERRLEAVDHSGQILVGHTVRREFELED